MKTKISGNLLAKYKKLIEQAYSIADDSSQKLARIEKQIYRLEKKLFKTMKRGA